MANVVVIGTQWGDEEKGKILTGSVSEQILLDSKVDTIAAIPWSLMEYTNLSLLHRGYYEKISYQ